MKVAIAGCGIAGSTAAFLLAEQGHEVTVFEQAEHCGPVGAGILLQPAGQAVLREIGILDEIAAKSARIDLLHAHHRTGRTLVRLQYGKLRADCFGLGVHRGLLFETLHNRCTAAGVQLRENTKVCTYRTESDTTALCDEHDNELGAFDLVVAADGSRSRLAAASGLIRSKIEYPYAAVWTVGPWLGNADRLRQIIDRDGRLVGILPIGNGRASFFWGTAPGEPEQIRERGLAAWRDQVVAFEQPAAEIIAPLTSLEGVTFASYRSVRLKTPVDGRLVFLGDAAHAMSPHLGQGTNFALADALTLATSIRKDASIDAALHSYANSRRRVTAYYSRLTAFLTPFFQTNNRVLQLGRDIALPVMPHIPFVGREMLRTLSGEKQGWLG